MCIECREKAFQLYRLRPNAENGAALRNEMGRWLKTRELAAWGPALAVIEILFERNHAGLRGWRAWMNTAPIRFLRWVSETKLLDRPLWNDYWMTRWLLTQSRDCAIEIHCRARHILRQPVTPDENNPWSLVAFTAEWMASSQRVQEPKLDAQLREIEATCANCLGPAEGRTLYVETDCPWNREAVRRGDMGGIGFGVTR